MASKGYKIVFQWRNPAGCVGDQQDWRSWRKFGTWPIRFATYEEAEARMHGVKDIFVNMRHLRKVSASIVPLDYRPCGRSKGKWS